MNCILLFSTDFIGEKSVAITDKRLDHIRQVHKASSGDSLRVGILNGKLGIGIIRSLDGTSCVMDVDLMEKPPVAMPLTLVLALPRPKVFRRVLECITAMGVKKIYVIETWRVEKGYWDSPFLKDEEIRSHCIAGLEQARDTVMPSIEFKKKFKPFAEDDIPEIIKNTQALVAHPGSQSPCPSGILGPITLAIGPEGGFIPFEVELLKKQGFKAVNFGSRILRVEHVIPAILGKLF